MCGAILCQKSLKANARFSAGGKRQNGREACQEFQIDYCVDANFSGLKHRLQRTSRESEKTLRRDRYHICIGNNFHRVENDAIIFEYDEVNIFTSNHFDLAQNCWIGENGRALLRELNEENAMDLTRSGRLCRSENFSDKG